jgi:hypothetical protein
MPTKLKLDPVMRGDTWGPYELRFSNTSEVCDGACSTSAPTKITSLTAAFTSASLNKAITLAGAGEQGKDYEGRITAVDSGTQVTVCPTIKTTVSAGELTFGVAEDITGDTLTLTLKTSNSVLDPAAALQNSETMPSNASSTAGIGFIGAPIAKTALVAPATYYYDIQRVIHGSPNTVYTEVYGTLPVLADTSITVA